MKRLIITVVLTGLLLAGLAASMSNIQNANLAALNANKPIGPCEELRELCVLAEMGYDINGSIISFGGQDYRVLVLDCGESR